MSRSRLLPTPSMSGEFIVKDQQHTTIEGTDVFALPPAAIDSAPSRRSSRSDQIPASPVSPSFMPFGGGRGQTGSSRQSSSGTKRPLEDFNDLPPPPTRTRKIIQMKPKPQQGPTGKPTAGGGGGGGGGSTTGKATKEPSGKGSSAPNGKKKQPSATSAAGRKIARKTAHSLIERRRRSKMNEEFTTLKDMIPACTGQDMHKLAILQASIDYVNYLEQCIKDLKISGHHSAVPPRLPPGPPSPTSPEFLAELAGSEHSGSVSPELLPENAYPHHHHHHHHQEQQEVPATSPSFSPRTRLPSVGTIYEYSPSTLPSPALGASPPTDQLSHQPWSVPSSNTSPAIQPRQSNASGADVDHEASAALLMLTQDRRGTLDSITDGVTATNLEAASGSGSGSGSGSVTKADGQEKRKGMSVRDLLIP